VFIISNRIFGKACAQPLWSRSTAYRMHWTTVLFFHACELVGKPFSQYQLTKKTSANCSAVIVEVVGRNISRSLTLWTLSVQWTEFQAAFDIYESSPLNIHRYDNTI